MMELTNTYAGLGPSRLPGCHDPGLTWGELA